MIRVVRSESESQSLHLSESTFEPQAPTAESPRRLSLQPQANDSPGGSRGRVTHGHGPSPSQP
eukprot:322563-Rhodomonas_salina.1